MGGPAEKWTLIAAVNDEAVLKQNLLRSSAIDGSCEVITKKHFASAALAYNAAMREASNEILVFAHQDVYLPPDWLEKLRRSLALLSEQDPNWAVLGVYGIDLQGQAKGHVFSSGLNRTLGRDFEGAIEATSFDEFLVILRRSSGMSFDPRLPGFHLFGVDICLEAHRLGRKCYVIPAYCIHNSNGVRYFPLSFWQAYLYLQRKWWAQLPVKSCCIRISRSPLRLLIFVLKDMVNFLRGTTSQGKRAPNPVELMERLRSTDGG